MHDHEVSEARRSNRIEVRPQPESRSLLIPLILAAVFGAACLVVYLARTGGPADPSEVAKAYLEELFQRRKTQSLARVRVLLTYLVSPEEIPDGKVDRATLFENISLLATDKWAVDRVRIEGDLAVIRIGHIYTTGEWEEFDLTLHQVGGLWRVHHEADQSIQFFWESLLEERLAQFVRLDPALRGRSAP